MSAFGRSLGDRLIRFIRQFVVLSDVWYLNGSDAGISFAAVMRLDLLNELV